LNEFGNGLPAVLQFGIECAVAKTKLHKLHVLIKCLNCCCIKSTVAIQESQFIKKYNLAQMRKFSLRLCSKLFKLLHMS